MVQPLEFHPDKVTQVCRGPAVAKVDLPVVIGQNRKNVECPVPPTELALVPGTTNPNSSPLSGEVVEHSDIFHVEVGECLN